MKQSQPDTEQEAAAICRLRAASEGGHLDGGVTLDDVTFLLAAYERGIIAFWKIAGLVDSEDGEPLDDAIRIANAALGRCSTDTEERQRRVDGAADIVDEAACLIWSELCPDTIMSDEDRTHYEAAAKAVLALSPAPEGEAVAWQKRPVFGDIRLRVWTLVEADPEVQDFWRTVNYEIRPLYATASTREAVIEECAKVCEGLRHVDYPSETSEWSSGTFDCAQAVRALRTKAVTK